MSVQRDDISGETGRAAGSVSAITGVRDHQRRYRCTVTSLPSPAGDIVVLRVAGEVDVCTVALLETALSSVLAQGPEQLIVDLAGVTFCITHGLSVLIEAAATAGHRTAYALSATSPQVNRILALLWPADQLPTRYPTARVGVLAAMARQTGRRDRVGPVPRRTHPRVAAPRGLVMVTDPDPARDTDQHLVEQARAGDVDAYRALVRRHRTGMYPSALQMLGSSEHPEDVAEDVASRLRAALAMFAQANPR